MTRIIVAGACTIALFSGCFDEGRPGYETGDPWGVDTSSSSTTSSSWSVGAGGGAARTATSTGTAGTATTSTGVGGSSFRGDAGFVGTYDKPVVTASTPPRPISGGTLTIFGEGRKAAIADSDRDQVHVVDLDTLAVTTTIALDPGDEPGRIVADAAGRLHVALRGGGAVAALDPATKAVLSKRAVCLHPRGLAYDATSDVLHVACVTGELVTMPAAGGEPTRQLRLARDLRDVVIDGDRLLVSRFRAADLLVVEADGHVSRTLTPGNKSQTSPGPIGGSTTRSFSPAVAWRTVPAPGGGALMTFQREQVSDVVPFAGGYGSGGCDGGIVRSAVAVLKADGTVWTSEDLSVTLPVDVATVATGAVIVVAGASAPPPGLAPPGVNPIISVTPPPPPPTLPPIADAGAADASRGPDAGGPGGCFRGGNPWASQPIGQVVAVAFDSAGRLVSLTREPALFVGSEKVKLPGDAIDDTGHELFHMATFAGLACASCHPEGHEDGHTWSFSGIGARRTQTLRGGILGTEPFHWNGDMKTFDTLAHEVFNARMSGPSLLNGHVQALAHWVDAVPGWKPIAPQDPEAVTRGRALFADTKLACTTCHAGPKFSSNASVAVGTGVPMQVPSLLGVGFRAPFMHNGCAATLADRFGPCGGGDAHGKTSALSASDRADLVAYLESL